MLKRQSYARASIGSCRAALNPGTSAPSKAPTTAIAAAMGHHRGNDGLDQRAVH